MTQRTNKPSTDLDRVALALSGLCLVHCLALPLLLVTWPLIAQFADSHWHLPMLALAVPVSVAAIVIGYRRHGNRALVVAGGGGLLLLILGATIAHDHLGAIADRTLTIGGSLLLAWVHWRNSRELRHARQRLALAEG